MEQKTKEIELRLLSVKQACELLGIGHWALYQLFHQHKLKSLKRGRRRLISSRAIDEYITSQERYGT